MFLIDGELRWSASDLSVAARCEYSVLRTLDYKLGRAERIETPPNALMEHIARLGDRHEETLLRELTAAGDVIALEHVRPPYSATALRAASQATIEAFQARPSVVYQAAFLDGEFFGYADFVERSEDGWLVSDAKLARSAKPVALLQLGAYADQIARLGLPVSSTVSLLLGNGERADFRTSDVLPVFAERRDRLRQLLADHRDGGTPIQWGDDRYVECGRCDECGQAAERSNDILLVAGLRADHRRKLRAAGITTIGDLARATNRPKGIAPATFARIHSQAALQWDQLRAGPDAPIRYELRPSAAQTLALLPAPSVGDLFFDFEGDPLYDEGDLSRTGLEYLWGVLDASGSHQAAWAHSSAEEREAFERFIDDVAERRVVHPDLHIYHYAAYETAALKRLAMRYQTREKQLDDLLRSEVFVDLYATVRGSVMISAGSYSIKKLEPLYMGDDLRSADGVQAGDASILAYHEFRDLRASEPREAAARLAALEDYNAYDCRSTLRLRDWLLERAVEAGVRDMIEPRALDHQGEQDSDQDPVFLELMARSGPARHADRTSEQQAHAMLAAAIDYYGRERKQFWWEHYDRLQHPVEDWSHTRDVFSVESVVVVSDWEVPDGRARNARRVLRLTGDWAPGSKPSASFQVVYATPIPPGAVGPAGGRYGTADAESVRPDELDPRVAHVVEDRPLADTFADLPVALAPPKPPGTRLIEEAIRAVAADAATALSLPDSAALDILSRRPPRLRSGAALAAVGSTIDDVVASLLAMDDSYVAIQGPPGTGKTYTGSRVIRELVKEHRWRIGVVAQSHAVVENMLGAIVKAGLDPALVGKNDNDSGDPTWTVLKKNVGPRVRFLQEHAGSGCVLGGTAWTFANSKLAQAGGLDLLVVDEAGQFALAPTLGASVSARRLLLLGDPQQLPQVSQGTHPEPVDESALGWLMRGHDTLPPEHGYFLGQTYRMHPRLAEKVSGLSYEGRLTAAPSAGARRLDAVEPGLHVVTLAHTGNRSESPEEASAVVAQVRAHLGKTWHDPDDRTTPRPLAARDFLVVAPYNAQVALIRRELARAGLEGVRVGTVDKFQGQEAPIAIVSMTASSHGDVPRGMGFLLSRNRVNVAVSRAQWAAILIRSDALTAYMPTSAHQMTELGAFVGLCRTS